MFVHLASGDFAAIPIKHIYSSVLSTRTGSDDVMQLTGDAYLVRLGEDPSMLRRKELQVSIRAYIYHIQDGIWGFDGCRGTIRFSVFSYESILPESESK